MLEHGLRIEGVVKLFLKALDVNLKGQQLLGEP